MSGSSPTAADSKQPMRDFSVQNTEHSRSVMNVTWRLADEDLEAAFVQQAEEAGMGGLKGHRSVEGIRASMYNGCPMGSVEALVSFMQDFEGING